MTSDPRSKLFGLVSGYMITQAIGAVIRLGVPELVSERPRSSGDLASALGTDPGALRRVLRTLCSLGIFIETDGIIAHTEMSELLRRDAPRSIAGQALMFSGLHYKTWEDSFETFKTGQPAFSRVYGRPFFDWLGDHPDEAAMFNAAMTGRAAGERQRLLERDWTAVSTVVDVGGGSGAMLAAILNENPNLTGIVYDLPHVREDAIRTIEAEGLADRCSFVAGSFFERVPAGGDVYVLSRILHDWDDASAASILQAVREAIEPPGRLLLVESVMGPGNQADDAKLLDLHMLVALGGRERTEDEWRNLLSGNGFTLSAATHGLIEATPS